MVKTKKEDAKAIKKVSPLKTKAPARPAKKAPKDFAVVAPAAIELKKAAVTKVHKLGVKPKQPVVKRKLPIAQKKVAASGEVLKPGDILKPQDVPLPQPHVSKPVVPPEAKLEPVEAKPSFTAPASAAVVPVVGAVAPSQIKKEEVVVRDPAAAGRKILELKFPVAVKDLAVRMQEKPAVLIKALMGMGVMSGINQPLEESVVFTLCEKYGFTAQKELGQGELALRLHEEEDAPAALKLRAPIVTLMGHVDHGKTSLLDAIRKSKVTESEHGGITQHIGAYRVVLPAGEITFLDTPGHEAFTAMRAHGAGITDIVVLVVAADDGIMPQTQEAIDHARAASATIVVALNKIDKPQADIERVKKQLSEFNLLSEDWGGKTVIVGVSAKTGQGIDELLEMILLEAQMLELKANPGRLAKGVVIEAKMARGKGPVSTLLVQKGTLHLNDMIVVGNFYGKIRAMFDDHGRSVTKAIPSTPVEVLGISGIPEAGEQFFVIKDEKVAKTIVEERGLALRLEKTKAVKRINLEDLHAQIISGKIKELKIVIKADVQGSLAAIRETINKIPASEISLNIIHEGVGNINYSDGILAVASDALLLGFNVVSDDQAKELIAKEGVDARIYNIIYELANDIKAAIEGMLEPKTRKVSRGRVEIRKVFKLSKSGVVAGCFVVKGKVARSLLVEVVRNGTAVFEGKMSSLKRFKDDVREVLEGYECGITFAGFDSMQEGDVIEVFEIEKTARKL